MYYGTSERRATSERLVRVNAPRRPRLKGINHGGSDAATFIVLPFRRNTSLSVRSCAARMDVEVDSLKLIQNPYILGASEELPVRIEPDLGFCTVRPLFLPYMRRGVTKPKW
ncbi:hypothetical protein EVAR_58161_1 [Eumeta japonica]|uniref:Uncharacterized protein n=1 Tax=Eumeta variegata TaxID=151549 RepID=A0A4C1X193_EUMVA|nr:hypothetical protein EVAR_58161_1 [Eumeta japonica]